LTVLTLFMTVLTGFEQNLFKTKERGEMTVLTVLTSNLRKEKK